VLLPPVVDRLADAARWVGVDEVVAERLLESVSRFKTPCEALAEVLR
jgi:hypothetical protein